jgi:hypothetical protein
MPRTGENLGNRRDFRADTRGREKFVGKACLFRQSPLQNRRAWSSGGHGRFGVQGASPHAATCPRLRPCFQGPRHPRSSGVPRTQEHPAHGRYTELSPTRFKGFWRVCGLAIRGLFQFTAPAISHPSAELAIEFGRQQRQMEAVKKLGELEIGDGIGLPKAIASSAGPRLSELKRGPFYIRDAGH